MGEISKPEPAMLIAAITSRYESAIDWSIEKATGQWGDVALKSPLFEFNETSFYEKTMGAGLQKQLVAFERLIDPEQVAAAKVASNQWEHEFNQQSEAPEDRPVNIDPGYITQAKLVLATTKNRDHRIYLQQGIFAEITLYFKAGKWEKSRWTYADYQRDDFQEFFTQCRDLLRARRSQAPTSPTK